jgi:phosphonate transport system substrate-binding protein
VPGSEAIALGEEDTQFESYSIANHSTGLKSSDDFHADISGKTFTFESKGSISGSLMPEFYTRQQFGKTPDEIFARVGFSGNHSRTIALVQINAS